MWIPCFRAIFRLSGILHTDVVGKIRADMWTLQRKDVKMGCQGISGARRAYFLTLSCMKAVCSCPANNVFQKKWGAHLLLTVVRSLIAPPRPDACSISPAVVGLIAPHLSRHRSSPRIIPHECSKFLPEKSPHACTNE